MSAAFQPVLDFDAAETAAEDGEALIVDVDGFEGPLHVLLALARTQKVDLLQLSILKLAEQYLRFVQEASRRRFALAADYLVMAAWLAYLKSRLLLPKPQKADADEPPAEEMAAALAFRLAKLDAMRKAVDALGARPQLGRDVFERGDPEATVIVPSDRFEASLYELVQAYVAQRKRESGRRYRPKAPEAYPGEEARERLRELLPELTAWTSLQGLAPFGRGEEGPSRASYLAGTLSGSLELVKEGALDVRQLQAFAEVFLRARADAPTAGELAAKRTEGAAA